MTIFYMYAVALNKFAFENLIKKGTVFFYQRKQSFPYAMLYKAIN